MKKFNVIYYFDGQGKVLIEAKNEKEAREKFFSGEFEGEEEWGEQYNIDTVETE
jgi:hypothetical protein